MKEQIINLNQKLLKIWPLAVVVTGLLLSASITFASFTLQAKREIIIEKPAEKAVLGLETSSATPLPSIEPSPNLLTVITTPKPTIKPSPSVVAIPTPTSTAAPQNQPPIVIQVVSTPNPTPVVIPSPSSSLEPSPAPVAQKVSIEIKQPDAILNFEIEIPENINVCQAMQKAKDEGKINSLTISDKYLESFGTLLIEEINGYKNNWVFTVNGESPMGCSQTVLKNGDKLAWEFLNL